MQVFMFQSEKDNRDFGFTEDRTGGNLPVEFAPWRLIGDRIVPVNRGVAGVGSSSAILAGIATDGYYLAKTGEMKMTRHTSAPG
jgi:hypothetical protein